MLYYLAKCLEQFDIPGMGLMEYITFRAGAAAILAIFIATVIGRRIIDRLQLMQVGEIIRDLGLEGQPSKKGTPTVAIGIYLRILFALGLDESILFLAKDDEMGRTLQDLDLKHRQRASKK